MKIKKRNVRVALSYRREVDMREKTVPNKKRYRRKAKHPKRAFE